MNKLRTLPGRYAALAICATSLAAALVGMPAHANEIADVSTLLEAKRYEAAFKKASTYVQKNPHDPQMRFLLGVSMAGGGRSSDAISVFTSLTADFPNLPEPYNNLAVLHAAARNYDSARAALESAIRADPGYATAYENLGDLYLQLANQAYAKVTQLAPDNANVKLRQSLLASINAQTPVTPRPSAVRKAMVSAVRSEKEAVLEVVREWTEAWSARDVTAYLTYYAADFRTPNREPRPVWEKKRRALIEGKARIEVMADAPEVALNDRQATVTYVQIYISDRYSSKERKTLVLHKEETGWKIVEERSSD